MFGFRLRILFGRRGVPSVVPQGGDVESRLEAPPVELPVPGVQERSAARVSPDILEPTASVVFDDDVAAMDDGLAVVDEPPRVILVDPETESESDGVVADAVLASLDVRSGAIAREPEIIRPDTDVVVEIPGLDTATDLDADLGSGLPDAVAAAVDASCPNCAEPLATRPRSRTTCGHCGRIIHVRARQTLFRSGLVGEDDVDAVDFLERIEPFGIEERQCLPLMLGSPLADVLWQLCEERLEAIPLARQAHLLNEMAQFLRWQGNDATPLRQRAENASLRVLEERGAERIKIVARGEAAGAACQETAGLVLDMAAALEAGPLPVSTCTSRDACRCAYGAAN